MRRAVACLPALGLSLALHAVVLAGLVADLSSAPAGPEPIASTVFSVAWTVARTAPENPAAAGEPMPAGEPPPSMREPETGRTASRTPTPSDPLAPVPRPKPAVEDPGPAPRPAAAARPPGTGEPGDPAAAASQGPVLRPAALWPGNPPPDYPRSARRRGAEGQVVVRVEVLPSGDSGAIRLIESSGYGILDEAAVAAVGRWRFRPARDAQGPVTAWIDVPVQFRLED